MGSSRASKKQQELLQFIDGFIQGNGYGPTYREIMRALGYKSVSTVAVHVDQLIIKGYLEKKDHSARSLTVLGLRPTASDKKTTDQEAARSVLQAKISQLHEAGQTDAAKTLEDACAILWPEQSS